MPPERSPLPAAKRQRNFPAAWLLLLAVILILAVWIVAATSALFGIKAIVDAYLVPADAGSTTGLPTPSAGGY